MQSNLNNKKVPKIAKNLITLLLVLAIISFQPAKAIQELIKAQIEFKEKASISLKLIPETIVDTELSLVGDFFSAYLTKPSAEILRVPFGSKLIGEITGIADAKSFNRDAKLRAHLNKIMLPDGSIVKVSADISSSADEAKEIEEKAKFKNFAKKVVKESSELSASALVGAVDSLQITGIGTAIATSGISTAVGAGLGLALGLTHSLGKKGETLYNSGFRPLNFKLESEFKLLEDLPSLYQNLDPVATSLIGVDVKVLSMQKVFSKSYGEFILVNLEIANRSKEKIFLGDFVLRSNSHVLPVYSNPLLTNRYADFIPASSSAEYKVAFSLGNYDKKDNYRLMMVDPISENIIADTEIKFEVL